MAEHHDRALDDLDIMKQAFTVVDERQRRLRAYVQAYAANLPERAVRTGLVPRAATVDREVEDAVVTYLDVLDRYPLDQKRGVEELRRASYAFHQVSATLTALAGSLDEFLNQYAAEFDRIGRARREDEALQEDSGGYVREAIAAAQRLQSIGLRSESVDRALERLRRAALEVEAWKIEQGRGQLAERVQNVRAVAAAVEAECAALPVGVERARRRLGSVRTRLEAVDTRRSTAESVLGQLRREFSVANWDDVEKAWKRFASLRDEADTKAAAMASSVRDEDWDRALADLDALQANLVELDAVVDGPTDRLHQLRMFAQDPEKEASAARFAVRDAQMLIRNNPRLQSTGLVRELDRLATRADAWRDRLEVAHPDYWSVIRELGDISTGAQDVVRRFREAQT